MELSVSSDSTQLDVLGRRQARKRSETSAENTGAAKQVRAFAPEPDPPVLVRVDGQHRGARRSQPRGALAAAAARQRRVRSDRDDARADFAVRPQHLACQRG
eukprot:2609498-Pleurochrysis_carterae.AAC.2